MKRYACAIAIAIAALCGCASVREPAVQEPVVHAPVVVMPALVPVPAVAPALLEPRADTRASELVAYFAAVARSGAAAQKKELAQTAAAFGRAPTPYARLKLGGLHALPTPGLRDDERALALLEPLAVSAMPVHERPIADLASLLYAQVAERLRLTKDDAKKQDDLRERIESMRSIDRSIIEREERQRTRRPNEQ